MYEITVLRNNCFRQAFIYTQRLFSTQPQCCLTFRGIELQMLLRCYLIHITIFIHFIFSIFVSIFQAQVYLCRFLVICFSFSVSFSLSLNLYFVKTGALPCLLYIFQNISCHFWMTTRTKKENNFKYRKFSVRVLLSFCLIFCF